MKLRHFLFSLLFSSSLFTHASNNEDENNYKAMFRCSTQMQKAIEGLGSHSCSLYQPDPSKDYAISVGTSGNDKSVYIYTENGVYKSPSTSGEMKAIVDNIPYQIDIPSSIAGQAKRICIVFVRTLGADSYREQKVISPNESCGQDAIKVSDFEPVPISQRRDSKIPTTNSILNTLANKISSCNKSYHMSFSNALRDKKNDLAQSFSQRWQTVKNKTGCGEIAEIYSPNVFTRSYKSYIDEIDSFSSQTQKNTELKSASVNQKSAANTALNPNPAQNAQTPTNDNATPASLSSPTNIESPGQGELKAASSGKDEDNQKLSTDNCIRNLKDFEKNKDKLPKTIQNIPMYFAMNSLLYGKALIKVDFFQGAWKIITHRLDGKELSEESRTIPAICLDAKDPSLLTIKKSATDEFDVMDVRIEKEQMTTQYRVKGMTFDLKFDTTKRSYTKLRNQLRTEARNGQEIFREGSQ